MHFHELPFLEMETVCLYVSMYMCVYKHVCMCVDMYTHRDEVEGRIIFTSLLSK